MAKMLISDAIKKFGLVPSERDGVRGLRVTGKKPTAEEIAWIKENKEFFLAELDHIATIKAKIEAKKLTDILTGNTLITVRYYDGEYLSGYMVHGEGAKQLEQIGLAKHISGWGYYIEEKAIKTLGEEFGYPAALEYMKPMIEAKEAKVAQAQAERQSKFDEAEVTGKPVVLCQWSDECDDKEEECNTDIVTEYAMPDRSVKRERNHTW